MPFSKEFPIKDSTCMRAEDKIMKDGVSNSKTPFIDGLRINMEM